MMTRAASASGHQRHPSIIVFLLLTLLSFAHAGNNNVTWYFPAGGETFYYSDVVNVSFTSGYTHPTVLQFGLLADNKTIRQLAWQPLTTGVGEGHALFPMNISSTIRNWFQVRNGTYKFENGTNNPALLGGNCWPFNILDDQVRAATTVGLPAAFKTDSASSAEETNGSGNSSSAPAGLSAGAIAGICVAAGIVSIGLGALAVICWLRRRKQSGSARGGLNPHGGKDAYFAHGSGSTFVGAKPAPSVFSDTSTERPAQLGSGAAGMSSPSSLYSQAALPAGMPLPNLAPGVSVPPAVAEMETPVQHHPVQQYPVQQHPVELPSETEARWELPERATPPQYATELASQPNPTFFPGSNMQMQSQYVNGQDDPQKVLMVDRFTGEPARASRGP